MASEHEPGCDRQHTARQRCNQNALFAEQGEVTPNGDGPAAATPAPAAKPARVRRAAPRRETTPPPAVNDEPADAPAEVNDVAALDEIVSIHEEVVVDYPADPFAGDRELQETYPQAVPLGWMVAAAVFGVVTAILILMLLRGGGADAAGDD